MAFEAAVLVSLQSEVVVPLRLTHAASSIDSDTNP